MKLNLSNVENNKHQRQTRTKDSGKSWSRGCHEWRLTVAYYFNAFFSQQRPFQQFTESLKLLLNLTLAYACCSEYVNKIHFNNGQR